jgi:spore coat-associated protein N
VEEVKKILGLTIAIVLIIGLVAGGTWAYFSDTETSSGNTFTAGTIDIAVNGENPWQGEGYFTIGDMKPCDAVYIDFTINNVGENEVDVWKHLDIDEEYLEKGGVMTEPECEAEGGDWDFANQVCVGNTAIDDIASFINYDLIVDGEVIIDLEDDIQITDIDCFWIYLGKIEPGEDMEVTQSYHLDETTGNEYQGDSMRFLIELFAQQIRGCPPPPGTELAGYEKPDGKYVDIGDPMSERGHLNRDVDDWSYVGRPDKDGNGYLKLGGYGGYDGGSANFRGLMGPPTGCGAGHYHANLVMTVCDGTVNTLRLRHLDGSQSDSFDVYLREYDGTYTLIGQYAWSGNATEFWVTTDFTFDPRSGKLEFQLVATDPVEPWCEAGWGQVMFNWAQVLTTP